jgi:hypothetical protein
MVDKGSDETMKIETTTSTPPGLRVKKTYTQELAIFTGTYSHENFLQLVVAPFAVCSNLAVLWMVIATGGLSAFFVAQSYHMAQIFMAPPYYLTAAGVGCLSIGPVLGGLLEYLIYGFSLDPLIKWCAKKNRGVYEPEYRLLGMIPSVTVIVGLCLFGYFAEKGSSYYITAFFHGMDIFGIVCATISASTYVLDAFRDISAEIFIINMVLKNFLFYGFSYFVNDWTDSKGPAIVFYTFAVVAAVMIFTTPLFFFWGKRYRSFWSRHHLLHKWGTQTHTEV